MHVHVTLDERRSTVEQALAERRVRGAKLTVIELWRGARRETDVMLTAHCKPGEWRTTLARLTTYAWSMGLRVCREKVEATLQEAERYDPMYYEAHLRAPNLAADTAPLSANSRNVLQPEAGLFLTFRALALDDITHCIDVIRSLGEVEEHLEAVIYDTEPTHDAWWAPTM